MNVPNKITFGRFFGALALFVVLALMPEGDTAARPWALVALVTFILTAASDFLDGYFARQLRQVTALGRMADPLVDKVLVCGTLIFLCSFPATAPWVPAWMVVVVVVREFLVTSLRGLAEARGVAMPAERMGKWKMVVQSVAAGCLLGVLAGIGWAAPIGYAALWLSLVLAVASGAGYAWRVRALLAA